jgi:hypothetical protein
MRLVAEGVSVQTVWQRNVEVFDLFMPVDMVQHLLLRNL